MKMSYQYALLHLSVLHADFERWEESMEALGECVATGMSFTSFRMLRPVSLGGGVDHPPSHPICLRKFPITIISISHAFPSRLFRVLPLSD